jgi:ketosteroid isomerase-like protein
MDRTQDRDEAEILRLMDRIIDRLAAKDLQGLGEAYASDVVSFDVQPPLQHVGRDAKLANWQQVFAIFETVTYEVRDLTLAVGDRIAYGHGFGRISGKLKNGTEAGGMWVRATFCFTKINDSWLITHDHASVPFDIGTGRGVTDLEP